MPRPVRSAKIDRAWRVPGSGMRDILDLLQAPAVRTRILDTLPRMMTDASGGAASAINPVHALLASLQGGGNREADSVRILDGSLEDWAALSDHALLGNLVIPDGYVPASGIDDWVASILPPRLAKDLGFDADEHVVSLRLLRASDPEGWALLCGGRLGTAMRLGRSFTGMSDTQSHRIIHGQALLFHVIATRMRVALIRRWTTRPMTEAIRYDTVWQYRGRMMMTALVEPARQIDIVCKEAAARADNDRLAGSFLETSGVVDLAREVHGRISLQTGRRSFPDAAKVMAQWFAPALRTLAAVTPEQIRADGLGMEDFVQGRLGVAAPHAVVILAAQLLDAPRQINAWIKAAYVDGPSPVAPHPLAERTTGRRALTRTTQWLRIQGQTDRNAYGVASGDPDDAAGRKLVRTAISVFAKRSPNDAMATLRIDPAWWFDR